MFWNCTPKVSRSELSPVTAALQNRRCVFTTAEQVIHRL